MIPYKKISLLIITCIFIQYCPGRDIKENQKTENLKKYSISSLDSLLLLKARDCQIVMLSDSYHGHGYFMYKLTNFLNHWVNALTINMSDQTIPHKIVLFLENNPKVQEQINKFIDTGDISTFLNYYIDYDNEAHSNVFTVDYMIYLYKLRKIKLHIEELKDEKSEYLPDFKIMGAEDYSPYTFEDIINMGQKEFRKRRLLWYAFERDKLSSHNVYTFIKDNPDYKAIVFYGGTHLYRNKLPKNFDKGLINDDMFSFYMAHYLDSLFTRKNISVFFCSLN